MLRQSCCFTFTAHPVQCGMGGAAAGEAEKHPQGILAVLPLVPPHQENRQQQAGRGQPRNSAASLQQLLGHQQALVTHRQLRWSFSTAALVLV